MKTSFLVKFSVVSSFTVKTKFNLFLSHNYVYSYHNIIQNILIEFDLYVVFKIGYSAKGNICKVFVFANLGVSKVLLEHK